MKRLIFKFRYYLFILPGLIFLGVFTYYPIIWATDLSFKRWNLLCPKPKFVGLENYIKLIHNDVFWLVLKNTAIFATVSIFPTMFFAMVLAILIDERMKGRVYYIYSIFYPTLIPMAAAAMLWVYIYSPNLGILNILLAKIGLPKLGWLGSSKTSLWALIIMTFWKNLGFFMLIYLAGLQNISKDLYEAAYLDGAGWWKRHYKITFPLLGPTTLFVFITAIILTFRVFDQINLMTEGGPGNSSNVIVYYIFENGFKFIDMGIASALTTILVGVLLILVLIIFGIFGKRITYEME
ncbi:MAG: sugar ABC transporter permease [Deltaproteobacteria bacterium]|nr:MAG: sugar ABC transporter permease [Deltaproteobacteria bacterium]